MTTDNAVWIFDVDGVITNLTEEKVVYPQILDSIVKQLNKNCPVALNTGRSHVWLLKEVIGPLKEKITDKSKLLNLFVVMEKGGINMTFNKAGEEQICVKEGDKLPVGLAEKVRDLVVDKYKQNMIFEAKDTMISSKILQGTQVKYYALAQKELVKDLINIIDNMGHAESLVIDPTTIGTDIQFKNVGKGMATKEILNWLKQRKFFPKLVIAFGDSISDLEIAEKIFEHKIPVELVFVGETEILKNRKYPFKIIFTKAKYDKGTVEFLKTLQI